MKDNIFVALSTFAEYGKEPLTLLKNTGIEYSFNPLGRRLVREEIVQMGSNASGIIAGVEPYDAEVLCNLPNLKCISRAGVGIENIDLNYTRERNIKIKNTFFENLFIATINICQCINFLIAKRVCDMTNHNRMCVV